jgi:hypothetical protein
VQAVLDRMVRPANQVGLVLAAVVFVAVLAANARRSRAARSSAGHEDVAS